MEVVKITPRGYCHGVVEAIRMAEHAAQDENNYPITILGYLVHNEYINQKLENLGINVINTTDRESGLQEINSGTVIFTAHGVSPQIRQKAIAKNLKIIDATCSDVDKTHQLIKNLIADNYHIIYIGKKGHPETEGTIAIDPVNIALIQVVSDIKKLPDFQGRLAVTSQTTISIYDNQKIITSLKLKYPDIKVYNEICDATQKRQEGAVAASKTCDLIIVVGSKLSNNTQQLVKIIKNVSHKPVYRINNVDEIDDNWFINKNKVGITSGASTPSEITRKVIKYMENIS